MTRIATVGYVNAVPLTATLDRSKYTVLADHPAAISERLVSGDVVAALVPVATVLANPELRIVPGQAIGADGLVTSVLIVGETCMEDWTHILLDGESRTSAMLLQVLLAGPLANHTRDDLIVQTVPPGTGRDAAQGTRAALVIGDAARDVPKRLSCHVDLAAVWKADTGLPFVFAVWAGRADLNPAIQADLRRAATDGLARRAELVDAADLSYVTDAIRYDLDDRALMGLRRFAALAKRAGLLHNADVNLFGPSSPVIPDAAVAAQDLADLLDNASPHRDVLQRVLAHARVTDLGLAANEARATRHPDRVVTYLPTPPENAQADDVVVSPNDASGYGETAPISATAWCSPTAQEAAAVAAEAGLMPCLCVAFGQEDLATRADALLITRAFLAAHPSVVAFAPIAVAGDTVTDHTATDVLRLTALARVVLDVPHLVAVPGALDGGAFHADVTQTCLSMGCDAVGAVPPEDVAEIERLIREAGFTPAQRDARFTRRDDAQTDGAATARRQPWTRREAPSTPQP